ncbi:hypothetical protein EXS54_02960 [Patescibacteria group bacterium]|nr:hypothetical protein [Patescibacteria group bacterium]
MALAVSASDVQGLTSSDQAKELFGVSDQQIKDYQTKPSPLPSNPDSVSAKSIRIIVSGITFRMTEAHHLDASGGQNSTDYLFSPFNGNTQIQSQLKFVYRVTNDSSNFGGLVWGDPGDGVDLDNVVGYLVDFQDSALAEKVLNDRAGPDALKWAKESGITATEGSSSFLDRTGNDPFQLAVSKVTEVINAMSGAIIGALIWAINQGELSPGIQAAWKVVRDLVNILFTIVLVALALMTIVRIDPQKYNVRSLLPILIFAVISVNFSLLFAEVMLNTATVLSSPFAAQAQHVVEQGGAQIAGSSGGSGFGESVVLLLAALIMLIALIVLLFFFIIRIIVIWLLAAASPVLFLFMVLPLTRGEASKLLTQWIRWVYMAPISFILLYIGSIAAFNNAPDDSTTNAILSAIFYAGLIFAAVMIPMALGGRLMSMLAKRGMAGAKLGGKGGLGLAGSIPLGNGMNVGELARTGKGYMKLRGDAQQQRGLERAAGWQTGIYDALGNTGLAASLTGRDATQASTVTEELADKRLNALDSIGWQDPDYRQTMGYILAPQAQKAQLAASMSADQLEQAKSTVGQRATAKALAKNGWWDDNVARRFGHTGYQKFAESDLAMKHLQRKRYGDGHQFGINDFDTTGFALSMSSVDGDGLRKIQTPFWDYMNPTSTASQAMPGASSMVRQMVSDGGLQGKNFNYNALRQNINARHRNSAPDSKRTRHAGNWDHIQGPQFERARRAIHSGMLDSREDRFIPLGATGPQSYQQAEQQQPPDYQQDT